ncbi:MAG: S9 family peptidase [Nanoarchaeota archaeon]|nr:S9 family peptidase [Nanoarchaeota archaeon]
MAKILPYAEWTAALTPEQIFSGSLKFSEVKSEGDSLYWLEQRPSEKGRTVLIRRDSEGDERELTPPGMSVRTKVHEYGGGGYTVKHGTVYFVNDKSQRIYAYGSSFRTAIALTPEKNADGSLGKYASLTISPDGTSLVFAYEKEFPPEKKKEAENYLGLLESPGKEVLILAKGRDFYADPCFSPDGKKLAWLQWNHPRMPWDETELMLADFDGKKLRNIRKIEGGDGKSICWPRFDKRGRLIFAMDFPERKEQDSENYWNLYAYDGTVTALTSDKAEFGTPHWNFGAQSFTILENGSIAASRITQGEESLVAIGKNVELIPTDWVPTRSNLAAHGNEVIFAGATSKGGHSLVKITLTGDVEILKKGGALELGKKDISLAKHLSYPTRDGKKAHAFLYLPRNAQFSAPKEDKPGLIVMAHGGPTSRASPSFSSVTQFWTSSGYAVLDCDYRGSTGYGRAYRDALYEKWGVLDIQDVADGVLYLIKEGLVDEKRVAVRGGSAGGYVAQCCLTQFPDIFKAGASYYGIGNLKTIVETTEKFESRYTQRLVGGSPEKVPAIYKERSPLFHLDKLKAPMILFQGEDDKIVPPACSREVAEALKKKGIFYAYYEYKNEGHGFRSKEANVDSLTKEGAFYRRVFSKDFYKLPQQKAP